MRWSFAVLMAVAACGYQPPPQTDTAAPAYAADAQTCRDAARASVNKANAKMALDWFASPVRRWGQISEATQSCMAGKGYGKLRWCTADELRSGSRQGTTIVTAQGVQCIDPPDAAHRQ